jgi:hypothetical protein
MRGFAVTTIFALLKSGFFFDWCLALCLNEPKPFQLLYELLIWLILLSSVFPLFPLVPEFNRCPIILLSKGPSVTWNLRSCNCALPALAIFDPLSKIALRFALL